MTPKMATDKVKRTEVPWTYQENSDAYTHIVRGPNNELIAQLAQDTSGKAEATARLIVLAVNNHENLVEALQAYEDAAVLLTDQQLIDNQPLMNAIVKGRELLLKVAEATLCPTK